MGGRAKNWHALPGSLYPERAKRKFATRAKQEQLAKKRREAERVAQQATEEYQPGVLVLNGEITPEGRKRGLKDKHLKTREPFPDLTIPLSQLKKQQAQSRGYEF